MENRYPLTLDLKNKTLSNIKYQQGDTDTSIIEINLVDGGLAKDITGQTIVFSFDKPDGTTATQDSTNGVSVINALTGNFQCILKNQTLAAPGIVTCQIKFTDASGKILHTAKFNFIVEAGVGDGPLSINYITQIETAIAGWQTDIDTMKAAYDAATKANLSLEVSNAKTDNINNKTYDTLGARLDAGASSLNDMSTKQGDITQLNTTDKSSLVNALKEVKVQADSNATNISANATVIANMGNASPKGVYSTLSALQTAFPTGTTGIYIVINPIADGKDYCYYWNGSAWTKGTQYQSTGIAEKSIIPKYFDRSYADGILGKNLFDKTMITSGKYVDYASGNVYANASYNVSDYIAVLPNEKYAVSGTTTQMAWYDVNKVYISGLSSLVPSGGIITAPSNAYYARFSMNTGETNSLQIEHNSVKTAYESYGFKANKYTDGSISPQHLSFLPLQGVPSKNLFNSATVTTGKYVQYVDGNLGVNATYSASDYISVLPSTTYAVSGTNEQCAWYDVNKVYISGIATLSSSSGIITAPSNAYYIRLSMQNTQISSLQIEQGNTKTTYDSYGSKMNINAVAPGSITKDKIGSSNQLGLIIPNNLYLCSNKELWIYNENIVENAHIYDKMPKKTKISNVNSSYLTLATERFTLKGGLNYSPKIDLLDYSSATLINKSPNVAATKTVNVINKAVPTGKTINTLCIGDSFIEYHYYIPLYMSQFATADGNTMVFKGTRITDGFNHEGRGGWSENDYLTLYVPTASRDPLAPSEQKKMPSPFVFSTDDTVTNKYFDFNKYLTDNAITNVDNIVFFLGENGGVGSDIDTMITNIKAALPNVKIYVCMIPNTPKFSDNLSYENIDLQITRDGQNDSYITKFDGRESSNVYLIPTHCVVNRLQGLQNESLDKYQFNDLNNETEVVNNGIHPTPLGAKSIAYMVYNYLAYFNA